MVIDIVTGSTEPPCQSNRYLLYIIMIMKKKKEGKKIKIAEIIQRWNTSLKTTLCKDCTTNNRSIRHFFHALSLKKKKRKKDFLKDEENL